LTSLGAKLVNEVYLTSDARQLAKLGAEVIEADLDDERWVLAAPFSTGGTR